MRARRSVVRYCLLLVTIVGLGMLAGTTTRVAAQECYWVENWQYVEEWGGWYDFGYWWCPTYGCTDSGASNYNPNATNDDGSCEYPPPPPPPPDPVWGCTDPNAVNYNPSANAEDGSCQYPPPSNPAWDAAYAGANALFLELLNRPIPEDYGIVVADAIVAGWFSLGQLRLDILASPEYAALHPPPPPPPPVYGCTDPSAANYNPNANTDDGSCLYPPPPPTGGMQYSFSTYVGIHPNADSSMVFAEADIQDYSASSCGHGDWVELTVTSPLGVITTQTSPTNVGTAGTSFSMSVEGAWGTWTAMNRAFIYCPCAGGVVGSTAYANVSLQQPQQPQFSVTLSSASPQEAGKPTHVLALKNTGDVVITATLSPPGMSPSVISWNGGSPGSSNLERRVGTGTPGTVVVSAAAGASAATITVHVVDAASPPAAGVNAPKTPNYGGFCAPEAGEWGRVRLAPGDCGVARPQFTVSPYFEGNQWVFRLDQVQHTFVWGIRNLRGAYDLPNGNPPEFPKRPEWSLTQAHTQARGDLDTSGFVPFGPTPEGPPRNYYWVESITLAHEQFHIDDFYGNYWRGNMDLFESDDVEAGAVAVPYNCDIPDTTTGPTVIVGMTPAWSSAMFSRHNSAIMQFGLQSEIRAHSVSNQQYVPIRNAIPNP